MPRGLTHFAPYHEIERSIRAHTSKYDELDTR